MSCLGSVFRSSEMLVPSVVQRSHIPFCLFFILVIFLSLAPLKEANGCRAGDAIAVTVVMVSRITTGLCLKRL